MATNQSMTKAILVLEFKGPFPMGSTNWTIEHYLTKNISIIRPIPTLLQEFVSDLKIVLSVIILSWDLIKF